MKYKLYKEETPNEWVFVNSGMAWAAPRPDGQLPDSNDPINIGWGVSCGSLSSRDWWTTTAIKEIVKLTSYEIIFKTENSTYKLETIY